MMKKPSLYHLILISGVLLGSSLTGKGSEREVLPFPVLPVAVAVVQANDLLTDTLPEKKTVPEPVTVEEHPKTTAVITEIKEVPKSKKQIKPVKVEAPKITPVIIRPKIIVKKIKL